MLVTTCPGIGRDTVAILFQANFLGCQLHGNSFTEATAVSIRALCIVGRRLC